LIGCGGAAGGHAMRMASSGRFDLVALTDPNEASLERIRERVPAIAGVPSFSDAAEMYDAVELDAVTIVTPHTLHYPLVMSAIQQGLHVLCEKPLTIEPGHAREIEAAAEAAGVTVMVVFQRRFDPAFLYMRRAIEAGELGELESIVISGGQGWLKATTGSWRQLPQLSGGGMLMDSGAHLTDMFLWLVDRQVESVSAVVDNVGSAVDINSSATVKFSGGVQGQLTVLGNLPTTWIESVIVTGPLGMLRYEVEPQHPWRTGRVVHYRDGGIVQPLNLPGGPEMHHAWLAAIRGEARNPSPPSVGVRVAELIQAIYRSASEGRTVNLNGADDAPGLLADEAAS
jgi:predicted dehydrogenase